MTEKNQLKVQEDERPIGSFYTSMTNFENGQRVANMLANSTMIPQDYRGNLPNCMLALEIASRAKMSPFMVMQNLDIIHGKPSWSSKFIIAMINGCGLYTRLRFKVEGEGNNMSCYATCKEIETDEVLVGTKITMQMAHAEKWTTKTGSKWKTMPEMMIKYRAAAFFAREHCPELLMGLYTVDENETMPSKDPLENIPDAKSFEYEVVDEKFDNVETVVVEPTEEIVQEAPKNDTIKSGGEQINMFEQKANELKEKVNEGCGF